LKSCCSAISTCEIAPCSLCGCKRLDHYVLADTNQPPLDGEVADDARIVVDVDDRRRCRHELGEVLILDAFCAREMMFERHWVGDQPLVVELLDGFENPLVNPGVKILRHQQPAHMVQRLVIGENGTKQ
jgi:hypothetical protein